MCLAEERCARWAWRARGGRGDIKICFRKKTKNNRKKQAVQMFGTGTIKAYTNLPDDWSGITNARRDFRPILKTHLHTSPIVVKIQDGLADCLRKCTADMFVTM